MDNFQLEWVLRVLASVVFAAFIVHLDRYGTAATVNDCLEKLHLIHSENTLSSDQEGGWYLETEIHTHDDIDACQMIDEFLKTEHVLGIEIK